MLERRDGRCVVCSVVVGATKVPGLSETGVRPTVRPATVAAVVDGGGSGGESWHAERSWRGGNGGVVDEWVFRDTKRVFYRDGLFIWRGGVHSVGRHAHGGADHTRHCPQVLTYVLRDGVFFPGHDLVIRISVVHDHDGSLSYDNVIDDRPRSRIGTTRA